MEKNAETLEITLCGQSLGEIQVKEKILEMILDGKFDENTSKQLIKAVRR